MTDITTQEGEETGVAFDEPLGQELPSIADRRGQKLPSHAKAYSFIVAIVLIAILAPAYALKHSQDAQQGQLEATFKARAPVTAAFVTAYVTQLEQHQQAEARSYLSGSYVDPSPGDLAVIKQFGGCVIPDAFCQQQASFQELTDVFGFQEAVLITDPQNVILQISKPNPDLPGAQIDPSQQISRIGTFATTDLPTAALRPGASYISNLKAPTATLDTTSVVEISTAFSTPSGNRILIGSYQVGKTPLSSFLSNAAQYSQHEVFLTDKNQFILASSPQVKGASGDFFSLATQDAALQAAMGHGNTSGFYNASDKKPSYFIARPILGTKWSLILSVPTSQLFATISGHTILVQWGMLAIYALIVVFAAELFYRFLQGRNKLQALTQELDLVSRLDPLTGIYNRRHLDDHLGNTVSTVRRHNQSISLMIADIDHFKNVNDTFGHDAGDSVLCEVTARMMKTLRSGDLLGRWGGEEFLIVLPMTPAEGARLAGERMREMIAASPVTLEDGQTLQVTASFGCASMTGEEADPDALIRRADTALYEAKETGRNKVVVADVPDPRATPVVPAPVDPITPGPAPTGPSVAAPDEFPPWEPPLSATPPVAAAPPVQVPPVQVPPVQVPPVQVPPVQVPPVQVPPAWEPPVQVPPVQVPPAWEPPVAAVPPIASPPPAVDPPLPPSPPELTPPYPGWWIASDGNWYPPELHPARRA